MVAGRKGTGEKEDGLKMFKLPVIKSHGDFNYSIGTIVYNTIITMYNAGWLLDLLW